MSLVPLHTISHCFWSIVKRLCFFFFFLQESNSNADNILLHPGRFYILLGTPVLTYKMAVQACAQYPS